MTSLKRRRWNSLFPPGPMNRDSRRYVPPEFRFLPRHPGRLGRTAGIPAWYCHARDDGETWYRCVVVGSGRNKRLDLVVEGRMSKIDAHYGYVSIRPNWQSPNIADVAESLIWGKNSLFPYLSGDAIRMPYP